MADNVEKDKDCLGDNWLSNWELQCLEEWENETNIEERLQSENERSAQKLWTSFQNSASSISRLYKGTTILPPNPRSLVRQLFIFYMW